ncbi:MAG: hypothetical protein AAFW81_00030 [Pseudomonadota bacterium]
MNDWVYVSRKAIGFDLNAPSPFIKTKVLRKSGRSVWIDPENDGGEIKVATSKLRREVRILIFRIGDYDETGLLDPLFKSVLQFCRIMLPDDDVKGFRIRSTIELHKFLFDLRGQFEHLILIAHGSENGLQFGTNNVSADELCDEIKSAFSLEPRHKNMTEIISLCCQTGKQKFAKPISNAHFCKAFIAPFHSVHGCVASLFCQDYLSNRILENRGTKVSARQARDRMVGATKFRLWENGKLISGPK